MNIWGFQNNTLVTGLPERKYRAGIIGCGAISRAHASCYKESGRTDLVAVADINIEALKKFSTEFSVSSTYTDYREMLDKEDLEIVSVCTWHDTHAEITIAAAERGISGIICEKPMATSLGQADAMLKTCEENGTKLTVAHVNRYVPVYAETRRLIKEGAIGKPEIIWSRTEGKLLNWGTHLIDLARYWLDDPETEWVIGQVERKTERYEHRLRIEDLCVGLICFSGGTRLILECGLPGVSGNSFSVYGTEGFIIPSKKPPILRSPKKGWQEMDLLRDEYKMKRDPILPYPAEMDLMLLEELLAWMEGRTHDHRCSGTKAHNTVEIMMAIYESLRTKGVVHIPLKTKENTLEMMIQDGTLSVKKPEK